MDYRIFKDRYQPKSEILTIKGDPKNHKSIFVLLDGTLNNRESNTNVRRLFDLLSDHRNQQTIAIYIEGVGTVDNLFSEDSCVNGTLKYVQGILGYAKKLQAPIGQGMESRILRGYEFISANYNPGDEIYIFGFSRGAHEARALAGLLSYAGVPKTLNENHDCNYKYRNRILDLTKNKIDEDYREKWKSWKPEKEPLLFSEIKERFHLEMRPVEVKFLGVWDTVPGSSFKKYYPLKEKIGFWKREFHRLPIISKGERYKTGSYPPIRNIVHAVSIDEKRSKYEPLLIFPAIKPDCTTIDEKWFPGAHSDVGGGYKGCNELPNISLEWMIEHLIKSYNFNTVPKVFTEETKKESVKGLAHWSFSDGLTSTGSWCKDRSPPSDAIHASYEDRKRASPVPILINNKVMLKKYPLKCEDIDLDN